MPKHYKNVSGQDLIVPALGGRLVVAGAEVEFDDESAKGLKGQDVNWQPVEKKSTKKEND